MGYICQMCIFVERWFPYYRMSLLDKVHLSYYYHCMLQIMVVQFYLLQHIHIQPSSHYQRSLILRFSNIFRLGSLSNHFIHRFQKLSYIVLLDTVWANESQLCKSNLEGK